MSGLGPISSGAILTLCDAYDATNIEFERIMRLEDKVYPLIAKRSENAGDQNQD
jgi:hypothetical protein